MSIVLEDREVTARTTHDCELCGSKIEPTTKYRRQKVAGDGSAWTFKACMPCYDLMEVVAAWCLDDEGIDQRTFLEWASDVRSGMEPVEPCVHADALAFLERYYAWRELGEVGTGAGEGAPRQLISVPTLDAGSAWVTRSEDFPEAPAQAHLPADDGATEGTCRACGQTLVHVPGERTYHPYNVEWPTTERCPALLPIGDSGYWSRRVPDTEFIPAQKVENDDTPTEPHPERFFPTPTAPYPNVLAYHHEHNLTLDQAKARLNPNGTHSSLWTCSECPDVFIGGPIGPIPPGYCGCGWVQKTWPRETCEECGRPLTEGATLNKEGQTA